MHVTRPRRLAAFVGLALCTLLPAALRATPIPAATPADWGAMRILGHEIAPGQRQRLSFELMPSFVESFVDTRVVVLRGQTPGLTLCVTGGIHGDELNGVEIARRVFASVDPHQLAGTLVVVPAVNAAGFRNGSRFLPDQRDLNRFFPGSPTGSTASRIADALFSQVIRHCHALIDLHSASLSRTTLPQIRTDLSDAAALALARSFGVGVVLDGRGPRGSLRRAALDAGIPAILYQAGEPLRFQEDEIVRGADGIRHVMAHLGLLPSEAAPPASVVYRQTRWVRVPSGLGGIFLTTRRPGDRVAAGEVLGSVTDPINDGRVDIVAPLAGRIIGMAVPQVVLPGSATFHLGYDEAPPE